MIFTTSQKTKIQKNILKRGENEINKVNETRYTGVILDNKLTWKCRNE